MIPPSLLMLDVIYMYRPYRTMTTVSQKKIVSNYDWKRFAMLRSAIYHCAIVRWDTAKKLQRWHHMSV